MFAVVTIACKGVARGAEVSRYKRFRVGGGVDFMWFSDFI